MPRPDVTHLLLRLCCVLLGVLLDPVFILQVGKLFELIFFNYGVRLVCTKILSKFRLEGLAISVSSCDFHR
jgi:hypothetical protein